MREGVSLTHYSFGLSNRANMLVVGLCGLVEALLTELALEQEEYSPFKLSDIRGRGYTQAKIYLDRTKAVNFGTLRHWDEFTDIYKVRNVIVHGHGGLVPPKSMSRLSKALSRLDISDVLIGDRRVRMHTSALYSIHSSIKMLIGEILKEAATQ